MPEVVPGCGAIDWSRPWLAGLRHWGEPWPWAHTDHAICSPQGRCAAALNAISAQRREALPVSFVPQGALPEGEPYEIFVRRTRSVPTRDNLHDWFNGLVWQRWPHTKARLNALQATEIARDGVQATRGPLRDALTLLDENGALLWAPPVLWQALQARDWQGLFITHRTAWAQARLMLLGHALLEQLVSPRKNITAHVLTLPWSAWAATPGEATSPLFDWGAWDRGLAQALQAHALAQKPFTPLPVLGVPGWWPDNETPTFYDDPQVFRPPRPHRV
jgi:Protein of unknown function (DUF3025)